MSENVRNATVLVDGVELEIVAEQLASGGWQLAVRNPLGVFSIWTDWFPSAKAAMEAGQKAIEAEGLEGFFDSEGFDYLLH